MTAARLAEEALARIPYARWLNLSISAAGDELTAELPYVDRLIGNPILPALHGGVLGAFLEVTALVQLSVIDPGRRQPRPISVTVEYVRTGKPLATFARARVRKIGRRVALVEAEAWQETRDQPIAVLHAHFLLDPGAGAHSQAAVDGADEPEGTAHTRKR